ncbi:hypothetical protein I8752_25380 [Nostocaceae cyanobacterium CENA369]|uniref:Uncharacterized protein n=1 Tax=Dendronalium phyllosphericum CENA369 TaxID=1725256 RepID=A0A8J7I968_9NOST|nr:hypothetical protein [Dendronalium phyllosphericum]MBH8576263.1 hypothetical protein [Dendronalium phyllosphericum CENA369]
MTVIPFSQPLLRDKQEALDFQDLQGLLRLELKIGKIRLFSGFYTRIDQVFILWGLICAGIFVTAQFLPISWYTQAIWWSVLTFVGTIAMVVLTWFWVSVERVRWLVYSWIILMVGGIVLTDASIFLCWGEVLMRLCPLWLGLSSIGYLCTALALRSRAFLLIALIHLLAGAVIPCFSQWQFLATGVVMAINLLILAELQWDMRPPIDNDILTPEQKLFNKQQHQRRQLAV